MSTKDLLKKKKNKILALAQQYGIVRIRLFGSAARGEETNKSDLDFLVAFEAGRSLLDLIGFKQALENLLEKKVDVISEKGVSPYLRAHIIGGAVPL